MDYQSIIDDLVEIAGMRSTSLRKRETCRDAANAITELLAQAEAQEDENKRLREAMKPNCLLCDSMHANGNCMEVGGFCTAVPAAHCPLIPRLIARVNALDGILRVVNGIKPYYPPDTTFCVITQSELDRIYCTAQSEAANVEKYRAKSLKIRQKRKRRRTNL